MILVRELLAVILLIVEPRANVFVERVKASDQIRIDHLGYEVGQSEKHCIRFSQREI